MIATMRTPRATALALLLALVLSGCSSPSAPETATGPAVSGDASAPPLSDDSGQESPGKLKGGTSKDGVGKKERVRGADPDGGGRTGGGSHGKPSSNGDDGSGGGGASGASSAFPAAGTYVYDQAGFEEFCQATSCDRQDLPPTQEVDAAVESQSDAATVVVTEARASEGRIVRTTTRYTSALADITKVYVRFDYEGFTFESTYSPQPPVESLHLPMTVDESWSGEWEARTSGDYAIDVTGRNRVKVGGRSVRAYRIETLTHFRGEFSGEAEATVWIDPATLAVVKSAGQLQVSSAFGDYNTAFTISLRSGPGY